MNLVSLITSIRYCYCLVFFFLFNYSISVSCFPIIFVSCGIRQQAMYHVFNWKSIFKTKHIACYLIKQQNFGTLLFCTVSIVKCVFAEPYQIVSKCSSFLFNEPTNKQLLNILKSHLPMTRIQSKYSVLCSNIWNRLQLNHKIIIRSCDAQSISPILSAQRCLIWFSIPSYIFSWLFKWINNRFKAVDSLLTYNLSLIIYWNRDWRCYWAQWYFFKYINSP